MDPPQEIMNGEPDWLEISKSVMVLPRIDDILLELHKLYALDQKVADYQVPVSPELEEIHRRYNSLKSDLFKRIGDRFAEHYGRQ